MTTYITVTGDDGTTTEFFVDGKSTERVLAAVRRLLVEGHAAQEIKGE